MGGFETPKAGRTADGIFCFYESFQIIGKTIVWHEDCFLSSPMMTKRYHSLKKVLFNVAGIALIYATCFFSGRGIETMGAGPTVSLKFYDVIAEAAETHDVHPALIAAVIRAESNFNPKAVSYAGAKGLMQINPPTQRYLRLKNVFDPRQNIQAGSRYLRLLLDKFEGDLPMAVAAYNAGPGAVAKHDGIPPYKETKAYVKKVLTYYALYRKALASAALMS